MGNVSEQARHEVHSEMERVHGTTIAETLMTMLPPDWASLATKGDLRSTEERLTNDLRSVDVRLTNELRSVDVRLTNELRSVDVRLTNELRSTEERLMATLHKELNAMTWKIFFGLGMIVIALVANALG